MNQYIRMVLVGVLMGAAEVVPGVSGGTIAFVSGFYERLVNGIARLTPFSLLELPKIGFAAWWKKYDLGCVVWRHACLGSHFGPWRQLPSY